MLCFNEKEGDYKEMQRKKQVSLLMAKSSILVKGKMTSLYFNNVIQEKVIVAGQSNCALMPAYITAYEMDWAKADLLDPTVFLTEGEDWESRFSYFLEYKKMICHHLAK